MMDIKCHQTCFCFIKNDVEALKITSSFSRELNSPEDTSTVFNDKAGGSWGWVGALLRVLTPPCYLYVPGPFLYPEASWYVAHRDAGWFHLSSLRSRQIWMLDTGLQGQLLSKQLQVMGTKLKHCVVLLLHFLV
jgi:hypothetical protein